MREPYPHFEPIVFDPIDGDLSASRALTRGLALLGVLILLTACLWL